MKLIKNFSVLSVIVLCSIFLTACFSMGPPITEEQFRQGFDASKDYEIAENYVSGFHNKWLIASKGLTENQNYAQVNFIVYEEYTTHASNKYFTKTSSLGEGFTMTTTVSSSNYHSFKGTRSGKYYVVIHSENIYLEIEASSNLKSEINNIISNWDY